MKNWIISILCVLCIFACQNQTETNMQDRKHIEYLNEFSNFLPDYFFDQGAWFGLQLLENQLGIDKALFLSDSLGYKSKAPLLQLMVLQNEQKVNFNIVNKFIPGRLVQEATNDGLNIILQVVYEDHQTALVSYEMTNLTNAATSIELNIKTPSKNGRYTLSNATVDFELDEKAKNLVNGTFNSTITLQPNESSTRYLTIRHRFNEDEPFTDFSFENASAILKANQERWYGYLEPYQKLSANKKLLAAKCIQTLVNNWRSPSGLYKHDGLFPSYYYSYFNGFWAWDSWRHAVALSTFEPELAKNQVRAMYDFQDDQGMIADAVWRDPAIYKPNLRNTKPPLSGWAIYEIFRVTKDTSFIKEMFPKLQKYHQWWYKNRDHNKNQLCEFGSTDGTREAAAWESGMDNAVRFDSAKMVKNNEHAWSLNQESVDLNTYLYGEKQYLIALGEVLNETEFVHITTDELKQLKTRIIDRFYDVEDGYLYDFNFETDQKIKIKGPEAWASLWFKITSEEQAKNVISVITDTTHFNTYCPFPTLDASHPEFNPENGYWRGPVWLDQAYIAIVGMKNYGFEKQAEEMKNKLLANAEGLLDKKRAVWENYDPRNGKPLNAKHFSWSSSHLLLLLNDEINSTDRSQKDTLH